MTIPLRRRSISCNQACGGDRLHRRKKKQPRVSPTKHASQVQQTGKKREEKKKKKNALLRRERSPCSNAGRVAHLSSPSWGHRLVATNDRGFAYALYGRRIGDSPVSSEHLLLSGRIRRFPTGTQRREHRRDVTDFAPCGRVGSRGGKRGESIPRPGPGDQKEASPSVLLPEAPGISGCEDTRVQKAREAVVVQQRPAIVCVHRSARVTFGWSREDFAKEQRRGGNTNNLFYANVRAPPRQCVGHGLTASAGAVMLSNPRRATLLSLSRGLTSCMPTLIYTARHSPSLVGNASMGSVLPRLCQKELQRLPPSTLSDHVKLVYDEAGELVKLLRG